MLALMNLLLPFLSFSRFRVTSVDESVDESGAACCVYPIDIFGSYSKAKEYVDDWEDEFAIQKVPLSSVFEFGTWLGQGDVNGNLGSSVDPRTCDVCGEEGADLYQCNGTFPYCCVQGYTCDGKGEEFGCQRGVVCDSCFEANCIARTMI